ncbi:RecT family recombinase, partial [Histophilus somni]|uniref:RecT family recombinase n=1 Tax=Histophilus somni TaxID=731 RepID=UPI00201ED83E
LKRFDLPADYSYKNAIQQTRFLLNKPIESGVNKGKTILDICDNKSVLQAVVEMAQKGLNPAKEQCYFIPYGSNCTLSISYQGKIAMAKREGRDIREVYGYAVYKDDEFVISFDSAKGTYTVEKYIPDVTKWEPKNLMGAFAVVINSKDEAIYTEYMTIEQIKTAWNMGAMKGNSPAHRNFPDQMAIKTVKNRAVKSFINSSDDSDLVSYEDKAKEATDIQLKEEIKEKANILSLEPQYEVVEEVEEVPKKVDLETGEIIEDKELELTPEQQDLLNSVPF